MSAQQNSPESQRLSRPMLESLSREQLVEIILKQEERIAELERRVGMNSQNSSRPPSSDWPGTDRPKPPPTGRRPGGQLMFQQWHRVRDRTLTRAEFPQQMASLSRQVEHLLEQGAVCGHARTQRTCRNILKLRAALWTFVHVEGVEPTNNAAERPIRSAVLWRKTSLGSQSEAGCRFVERMLTVTATLKQQHRNVVEYLTEACHAAVHRLPAPTLLPHNSGA